MYRRRFVRSIIYQLRIKILSRCFATRRAQLLRGMYHARFGSDNSEDVGPRASSDLRYMCMLYTCRLWRYSNTLVRTNYTLILRCKL